MNGSPLNAESLVRETCFCLLSITSSAIVGLVSCLWQHLFQLNPSINAGVVAFLQHSFPDRVCYTYVVNAVVAGVRFAKRMEPPASFLSTYRAGRVPAQSEKAGSGSLAGGQLHRRINKNPSELL